MCSINRSKNAPTHQLALSHTHNFVCNIEDVHVLKWLCKCELCKGGSRHSMCMEYMYMYVL